MYVPKPNSKTSRIFDFLEVNPDIRRVDVLKICKKLECSERLVWRALRLFKENHNWIANHYRIMKQLIAGLEFFTGLILDLVRKRRELRATEMVEIDSINKSLSLAKEYVRSAEGGD